MGFTIDNAVDTSRPEYPVPPLPPSPPFELLSVASEASLAAAAAAAVTAAAAALLISRFCLAKVRSSLSFRPMHHDPGKWFTFWKRLRFLLGDAGKRCKDGFGLKGSEHELAVISDGPL